MMSPFLFGLLFFFFFNDTATTEIYTLSLHDALPISMLPPSACTPLVAAVNCGETFIDRKSTRLNSSHQLISYAVFCLKKKNKKHQARHSQLPTTQPHHPPTPSHTP